MAYRDTGSNRELPAPTAPAGTQDLPSPLATETLKALAETCAQAPFSETLPSPPLRLFSTWEICHYMIPMAPGHLRRVLRAQPELPQGRTSGSSDKARWFTLEEVLALRRHFDRHGARGRRYLPYRPAGLRARVTAVAQTGRGAGKTTTVAHLALAAAMDGYRVLVIDLDPQAELTQQLTRSPLTEDRSVVPMIARHCGTQLRQENRRRLDHGEPTVPMEAAMDQAMERSAADAITASRWPGVDLLGAGPALHRLGLQIPLWQSQVRSWRPWQALGDQLAAEGVLARYDAVLIDTGAPLGPLTVTALAAADMVLVPLVADPRGAAEASAFLELLHEAFRGIEERETRTARALGRPGLQFSWESLRLVLTRFDDRAHSAQAARLHAALGEALLPQRQELTALLGPGRHSCVYEADYRETNRETFARARAPFDAFYAAWKSWLTASWQAEEAGRAESR
ncbi:ParA family protein [Marinovum sp.]|uniref:ParA family protein n=1 Tax=Marinovum sp. TaxID=2024839 RepID=UPI003A8F68EA